MRDKQKSQTGSDRLGSDDYRNEGAGRPKPDDADQMEPRGGSVNPNSRKEPSDDDAMRSERGRTPAERGRA